VIDKFDPNRYIYVTQSLGVYKVDTNNQSSILFAALDSPRKIIQYLDSILVLYNCAFQLFDEFGIPSIVYNIDCSITDIAVYPYDNNMIILLGKYYLYTLCCSISNISPDTTNSKIKSYYMPTATVSVILSVGQPTSILFNYRNNLLVASRSSGTVLEYDIKSLYLVNTSPQFSVGANLQLTKDYIRERILVLDQDHHILYSMNHYLTSMVVISQMEGLNTTGVVLTDSNFFLFNSTAITAATESCTNGYYGDKCLDWDCFGASHTDSLVCSSHGACIEHDVCLCSGYTGFNCTIPICYGRNATDPLVCNGGTCNSTDSCTCTDEFYGSLCTNFSCFGYPSEDVDACNGVNGGGMCTAPDTCDCSTPYIGLNCTDYQCGGFSYLDSQVCNAHAECTVQGNVTTCSCSEGYAGNLCEFSVCSSVVANDSSVCSGRGNCTAPDTCICSTGYTGSNCELIICFGHDTLDNMICNGNGQCTAPDNCSCSTGYYGTECDRWNCFSISSDDSAVCNFGNGTCAAPDSCECNTGYTDSSCNIPICFETVATDPSVCSTHGTCTAADQCNCLSQYSGSSCDTYYCGGISNDDDNVCSGQGLCISPNNCSCNGVYTGELCDSWACNGIPENNASVCSGHGTCSPPDKGGNTMCKCDSGYTNEDCSEPICFELPASSTAVCSGLGNCTSPDSCVCADGQYGTRCEAILTCNAIVFNDKTVCSGHGSCDSLDVCSCESGYAGEDCELPACFSISSADSAVCNSRGECVGSNICSCTSGYTGAQCELNICWNLVSNDSKVCSGHGSCTAPNICSCFSGYGSEQCNNFTCDRPFQLVQGAAVGVCSGNGACTGPNTCSCNYGYSGQYCKQKRMCFGNEFDSSAVCSFRKGVCIDENNCSCNGSFTGSECELNVCYGIAENNAAVCSGHGACIGPQPHCSCQQNYTGNMCEIPICYSISGQNTSVCSGHGQCSAPNSCVCDDLFTGQLCNQRVYTCYGQRSLNPSVCSGHGQCIADNTCNCTKIYEGINCEIIVGDISIKPKFNQLIESCSSATISADLVSQVNGTLSAVFQWSLISSTSTNTTISNNLKTYIESSKGNSVQIPHSLLDAGNTFYITITANYSVYQYFKTIVITKKEYDITAKIDASDQLTMRRSKSYTLFSQATSNDCVTLTNTWRIIRLSNNQVYKTYNVKHLTIPSFTFDLDGQYRIEYIASFMGRSKLASVTSNVLLDPMQVTIRGGDVSIKEGSTYELDASESYDPEYRSIKPTYIWSCVMANSTQCSFFNATDSPNITFTGFAPGYYNLTVVYQSIPGRATSTRIMIEVKASSIPRVGITSVLGDIISSKEKVSLRASIEPVELFLSGDIVMQWEVRDSSGNNVTLDSSTLLTRTATRRSLILREGVLKSGTVYSFTIKAKYKDEAESNTAYSTITTQTSKKPQQASDVYFQIEPASGTSMLTQFTISALNWTDDTASLPLRYSFEVYERSIQNYRTIVPFDINSNIVTKFLNPPGSTDNTVKIQLRIRNYFEEEVVFQSTIIVEPQRTVNVSTVKDLLTQRRSEASEGNTLSRDSGFSMIAAAQMLVTLNDTSTNDVVDDLLDILKDNSTESTEEEISQKIDALQTLSTNANILLPQQKAKMASILIGTIPKSGTASATESQRIASSAGSMISNIIKSNGGDHQEDITKQSSDSIQALSLYVLNSVDAGEDAVLIQTESFSLTLQRDYADGIKSKSISQSNSSVYIPSINSIASGDQDTVYSVQFLSYPDSDNAIWEVLGENTTTGIVTFKVLDSKGQKLTFEASEDDPLVIVVPRIKRKEQGDEDLKTFVCHYYDETSGGDWGTTGCWLANVTETEIICHCNHTTSFAAMILYSGRTIPPYTGIYASSISINIIYIAVCVPIFILLIILRNEQPLRSRFLAPYLGIAAILIDAVLQGIIRNSLLVSRQKTSVIDAFSYVILVTANPAGILALAIFLWQQIRFLFLQNLYSFMSRGESQSETLDRSIMRATKVITSKLIYLILCVIITVFVVVYFGILMIAASVRYSDTNRLKHKTEVIMTLQALSYSIMTIVLGVLILGVLLFDIIYSVHKTKSTVDETLDSTGDMVQKQRVGVGIFVSHFMRNDPLMFRVEATLLVLTVFMQFIVYIIGIVSELSPSSSKALVSVRTALDLLLLLIEIAGYGGWICIKTLHNRIARRNRGTQLLDEVDEHLEAVEADKEAEITSLLRNETGYKLFHNYCQKEFSLENLLLWRDLEDLRSENFVMSVETRKFAMTRIVDLYFTSGEREVNVSAGVRKQFTNASKNEQLTALDVETSTAKLYSSIMINISDTHFRFSSTKEYERFLNYQKMHMELESAM
jgi:hypothetical protein